MSQPQRLADPTPPGHRPAPHADVPRVHSLEAVGLQLSRHLARSRRQGGRLTVIWIEAALHARPGAAWPDGAYNAPSSASGGFICNTGAGGTNATQRHHRHQHGRP